MTEPKYRCSDCKRKYKNDKQKAEKNYELMACRYLAEKPRHNYNPEHNNKGNPKILYRNCIGNYYDNYFASLINYYNKYNNGILPFNGGLFEQPSKFVEVMELVHNLINENNTSKEKKEQLLSKRRNGTK